MTQHELRFAIAREQRGHQNTLLTALLVSLVGIISAALGPQIVYEYVLANAEVNFQMMVLQYFPVVCYVAVVLSLVWAVAMGWMSSRRVRMYDQELQLLSYTDMCCGPCGEGCTCECHDGEKMNDMMDTESVVPVAAPVISTKKKTATRKKRAAKKA